MFLHISAEKPATQEAAVGTQSNLLTRVNIYRHGPRHSDYLFMDITLLGGTHFLHKRRQTRAYRHQREGFLKK